MNNNLKYFIGKFCTIITKANNRNFKEENPATFTEQNINYFTGMVTDIDSLGILMRQIDSDLKSYFIINSITSIHEEKQLDLEKDQLLIEEIKNKDKNIRQIVNKYEKEKTINVEELEKLIE